MKQLRPPFHKTVASREPQLPSREALMYLLDLCHSALLAADIAPSLRADIERLNERHLIVARNPSDSECAGDRESKKTSVPCGICYQPGQTYPSECYCPTNPEGE
jgi:hypothetical protein